MLRDGRQKWPGVAEFGGGVARRGGCASLKGKHFSVNAPRPFRPTGLSGEAVTYEAWWAGSGELGRFLGKVSKWKSILNFK
jgi:hypothetical protein